MNFRSALRAALGRQRPPAPAPAPATSRPVASGPAPAVEGVTAGSEAIAVDLSGADVDLVFLTSSCRECKQCWARATAADVIVTPDPATDSPRAVARLAPPGVTVVMSSPAWHSYGITKAPWRVKIRGGEIVSSGPAVQLR
ncbi:MAG TPA: hypothetical protein VNF71_10220 [Acidimicrobiales bacterium]|nr:hypothetical protein [Acidimicrobiales bacterium]